MSKNETPLTLAYWERVGGTLYTELRVGEVRAIDGVIVPDGPMRHVTGKDRRRVPVNLRDRHVIVVQTKGGRPSLPLLGQALFSPSLVQAQWKPASIKTVALCGADDDVMRPLAEARGIEVVSIRMGEHPLASSGKARYDKDLMARYWSVVGGTLLSDAQLIPKSSGHDAQRAHGLILIDQPHQHMDGRAVSAQVVDGAHVIVAGTRRGRLDMYTLGQALFAADLLRRYYSPASVRTVIVCGENDEMLRPAVDAHGIEVAVL